jgi:site-specific DNA-methyltransferase (adenine-specific)
MKVEIGNATLYLGDCLEVMAEIADNSIRMIWTDPPYGHSNMDGDLQSARAGKVRGARQAKAEPIANDGQEAMRAVMDGMLRHAARVLSPDCCCCCCGGGGPSPTFAWVAQRMDADGLSFFHSVIWDKTDRGPGMGWRFRRDHEHVMVAHRKGGKLSWASQGALSNIQRVQPPIQRSHPNEKPIGLVERFVRASTLPGETVLDPFMGSGTTGVACANLGRKFIGIEIEPKYFDIACERIRAAQAQHRLFA